MFQFTITQTELFTHNAFLVVSRFKFLLASFDVQFLNSKAGYRMESVVVNVYWVLRMSEALNSKYTVTE